MSVTLNTQNTVFDNMRNRPVQSTPSFKANEEVATQPQAQDEVVTQEPKKKKGFIRKFKDGISSIKKFFVGVGEYAKGTVKGLFFGGIAAGSVIGVDAIRGASKIIKDAKAGNLVKPVAENVGEVVKPAVETASKAVKVLSTKGKVIAGAVGLAVLGYNLFKASLNASEKKASIDHRWGSGHND